MIAGATVVTAVRYSHFAHGLRVLRAPGFPRSLLRVARSLVGGSLLARRVREADSMQSSGVLRCETMDACLRGAPEVTLKVV